MDTLISVRYRNNREGLVDDVTLNDLIRTGGIRQFYRLSEGRWVDIEIDPVRRSEAGQPGFGRRATDKKQEDTHPCLPQKVSRPVAKTSPEDTGTTRTAHGP